MSYSVAIDAYPNVEGVGRRQADGNVPVYNRLVVKAKACITPGLRFYQRKFIQEFHNLVRAFRSARLCCPVQVKNFRPTAASFLELRNFSSLDNDAVITGLSDELPRYLASADGTQTETEDEKVQWWTRHEASLPNWSSVVK